MNDKKIIVIGITLGIFFVVMTYGFLKIVIKKDYIIAATVPCEVSSGECFNNKCLEDENGDCLGKYQYYKVIKKRAYNIPDCYNKRETDKNDCPPLVCEKGERDCVIESCFDNKQADKELCTTYF